MDGIDHGPLRYYPAADGARLAYRVHHCGMRDAPALVMVHGVASNSTRFSELSSQLRLRGTWDLLRPDLRGHGASMHRGRLTRELWCGDLLALLDAEGHERAVFLGHSLGAQVIMDLAVAHPARVRGLILVDPVFPGALRGMLGLVRRLGPLNRLVIALLAAAQRLDIGKRSFPYRDLAALDARTRELLRRNEAEHIGRLYMNPRADLRYLPLRNYLQDLREVVRPVPDPSRIRVPVLVLRSAGASVSDRDAVAGQVARFPLGRHVDIDADHWLLTERPVEARHAIEHWCEQLIGETPPSPV
jgi:pimeloyl-ACP methyl ester carboxylesterase